MSNTPLTAKPEPINYIRQIIIVGIFFFIFGFITWVNGTLIPYLKIACELHDWQVYFVTFAFYIAYTVMALPAGGVLRKTGMINGMRLGLVIMAVGCGVFVGAAYMRSFGVFLTGLFIIGIGLTLLQTAVNPYITLLGPANKAAQRISIMGICNKFAGILAPIILGAIILKDSDSLLQQLNAMTAAEKTIRLDQLALAVVEPYTILAVVLLIVAFAMKFAHLPEVNNETPQALDLATAKATSAENKKLLLGFTAIFCYVGVEVMAGDTIANYGLHQGLSLSIAKSLTKYTLSGMLVGYALGALCIPKFFTQEKAFLVSSIGGILISMGIIFLPGTPSLVCIALLGLTNALMWPAIWPQALRGLRGAMLNKASSLLIMGIAGGAIVPLVFGWLSEFIDMQLAYFVLIPCYLYSVYYWYIGKQELAKETDTQLVASLLVD